jgi:2-polyprenyl-6-methoxyphenol hydroxylase-like FAD-dependent oxidoreductase
MAPKTLTTDFLIIGAGPAGASLACFLASHSLTGILLSSAPGTAATPRAHITNPPALEALRDCDAGIYDECVRLGTAGEAIKHYRFVESLAGEEFARNIGWGLGERMGEYKVRANLGSRDTRGICGRWAVTDMKTRL